MTTNEYQVLNQSNRILASYRTLTECAADMRRRHRADTMGARAAYKVERADDRPLNEDERDELWRAQAQG